MRHLKKVTLITLATVALTAMAGVSGASATELEIGGVGTTAKVKIKLSLEPGTSLMWSSTTGELSNECGTSNIEGETEGGNGTRVGGPISSLTFENCAEEPVVVDTNGRLEIAHIPGTTNGTVFSVGTKVTVPSRFGGTLTCTTASGEGTDIGTLTGKGKGGGNATMDINATLNCGFFLPSASWKGSYLVTSPTELGVN